MTFLSVLLGAAALLVAAWAVTVVLLRRYRPPFLEYAVWGVAGLAVLRALAGAGSMLGGERPADIGSHIGYLVAAVCLLPLVMSSLGQDKGLWSTGAIGVAALAVAVVAWRLQATW